MAVCLFAAESFHDPTQLPLDFWRRSIAPAQGFAIDSDPQKLVPPSLCNFFKSSYQQYKEDTNTVASWLATTAQSHGYPQDLLLNQNLNNAHTPCPQSTRRLKGKKRMEAKQAAATSSGAARKPTYVIAINDFIRLAQFIAAKRKPLVKVPVYFTEALERAIKNRKKHGIVAASLTDSKEANNSHSHFVGVLEHVRKVLGPFMPTKAVKEPKPTSTTPTNKFGNRFTTLHVEEPATEFLNTPVIDTQPAPNFKAEQLDDREEARTAFQLLCEDIYEIRQVVCNLWVGYKFGQYDLIAISLVTNTAVDFVRALENDVSPLLEKHGGSSELLESLWKAKKSYMHKTEDGLEHDKEQASLYAVAEKVMYNAHLLLQRFMKHVGPSSRNHIPFYPSDNGYDPTSCRETKTPSEKFVEDTVLLNGFLSLATFHIRRAFREETTLEDELIRGLRLLLQTEKIQLWNVLSIQLFLDMHHILRQDADRPFHEMREAAYKTEMTIDQTLDFHKHLRPEDWPEPCDRAIKNLKIQIDVFIRNDPYQKITEGVRGCPEIEEFLLFRRNPVLCGLWMYRFQVVAHEVGVLISGTLGGVLYTCHLYHAIRNEKLLQTPWEDMETLMELQAESTFGNRRPENRNECMRRFLLATGVSASTFAKDSRVRGIKRSKCLTRGLAWQAPLTRIFRHRYCENSRRFDFTPEELEKIMEKTGNWADDGYEEIGIRDVIIGLDSSWPTRSQARREAKGKSKGQAPQRVPMPVLLKRMCNALQGETKELTFDYLHMHRQCWSLLRSIKQESLETFRKMDGSHILEEEGQLPQLVGFILSSALPESKPSRTASSNAESSGALCPLLAKSANAIEALIDRGEGSVAQERVFGDNPDRPTEVIGAPSDLAVLPQVGAKARRLIIPQPAIAYHRIG
ncbi:hypothetical protein BKA80DRAFT_338964 [Phyllosticta citrichinensis]